MFLFTFTKIFNVKKGFVAIAGICLLCSCSIFKSNKTGCPTNGKNVGAEKLAAGDPKAMKDAKKAGKFKY